MSTFVRFIVLVLILGVIVNLGMVMFSNDRSRRKQSTDLAQERALLEQAIRRMSEKLRHGEMVVEWQKVDSKDKVLQSSLLVRQFAVTEDGQQWPLATVRVVIPGAEACVEGIRLEFGANYPAEYGEMRGRDLALFTNVYSEETEEADRFSFWPTRDEVPQLVQVHSLDRVPYATYFETTLWQKVWDLVQEPEQAEKYYDLKVLTAGHEPSLKACKAVRNGVFYEINVGIGGVTITESSNWVHRNEMLEEGRKLKEKEGESKGAS